MSHPVAVLRQRLADDFSTGLPPGVHPVSRFYGDPQLFPGASGLLESDSWHDVAAGMSPPAGEPYPLGTVRVMVVGNYQATRSSYERILSRDIGGFPATWRQLQVLLAAVPPRETFLAKGVHRAPRR